MSVSDSEFDIDIDDDEIIQMQYKQKGIRHPSSNVVHVQKPHAFAPNSLTCKVNAQMSDFKTQIGHVQTLGANKIEALRYYTSEGYEPINNYLRHGGDRYTQKVHTSIQLIDSVFVNTPPLQRNVVVYRGIKSSYIIDADFVEKSYTSTTVDLSVASEFNNNVKCCIFKILIPRGARVVPLVTCSDNASELEILLPRNSQFKIESVAHDDKLHRNIITLKLVL